MPREEEERASACLLELFPPGHEVVERANGVELAVYVERDELARFRTAFPDARVVPFEEGWEERWREFHHGVVIGPLWIGPPWEDAPPDRTSVVIDPGRAFGTGAHATTRLCIELLVELAPSSLLDIGCGSGVISIAAAKLGFAPVWSVDVDEAAVDTTRTNADVNGVEISARRADALADPLPKTDVAVANIALRPLQQIGRRLAARHVITSGYLATEFLRLHGLRQVERYERDGWAADLLERR